MIKGVHTSCRQNYGRQSQFCTSKKVTDGSLAISAKKYNVLLFAKYGLYSPALEPKHGINNHICMMNKGTFTCLSYNTNKGKETIRNQYGSTGITLNADMRSIMTKGGSGGDPTKLGR